MSDVNLREPIPFVPPVVKLANLEDGLLKTADLNSPIPVEVMVWEAAEPGYYFQLVLNGEILGDIRTITAADKAGDVMTVYLSEILLEREGIYSLGYMTTSPNTEVSDLSPTIPLKVDRTPPGAALLAPIIFPSASSDDSPTGLVPGYAGMEPGDTIQTLCNGTHGPTHVVQPDELTIRPIAIVFERKLLQSLAAENVSIEYMVTDRAGNPSIMSQPVALLANR